MPANQSSAQTVSARLAHDYLGDVLLLRDTHDAARHAGVGGGDDLRAQFARQGQVFGQAGLNSSSESGCGCST